MSNADVDLIVLCSQEPTTFAEAFLDERDDGFRVGEKVVYPGDVPDDWYEFLDGLVTENDVARWWAMLDTTREQIIDKGEFDYGQAVTNGNPFTLRLQFYAPTVALLEYSTNAAERVRHRAGPTLREGIEENVTTLCHCFKVTRRDGRVMGFTNHDEDVRFKGVTYEASAGMTMTDIEQSSVLDIDTADLFSALISERINEDDIAAKLFDDAQIEVDLVDWNNPRVSYHVMSGSLGEIERKGVAYKAELRSKAHYLNQEHGSTIGKLCEWDLGDERCQKNLTGSDHTGDGAIDTVIGAGIFVVTGISGFKDNHFSLGLLTFTSGSCAGLSFEVLHHFKGAANVTIELLEPQAFTVEPGDTFFITSGCNKELETCNKKFANAINFGGFPHVPGNDALLRFPDKDDENAGDSLFK